jgi:hypothetical protein
MGISTGTERETEQSLETDPHLNSHLISNKRVKEK